MSKLSALLFAALLSSAPAAQLSGPSEAVDPSRLRADFLLWTQRWLAVPADLAIDASLREAVNEIGRSAGWSKEVLAAVAEDGLRKNVDDGIYEE